MQASYMSGCHPQGAAARVFRKKEVEMKCKGERIRELALLLELDHCSVVYLELPKVQTTLQLRVCQQQLATADKLDFDFAIHEA